MKKFFGKFLTLASVVILGVAIYRLMSQGLSDAISVELRRYSDMNINYLYIALGFIMLSYFIGWAGSKLRTEI